MDTDLENEVYIIKSLVKSIPTILTNIKNLEYRIGQLEISINKLNWQLTLIQNEVKPPVLASHTIGRN